MRCQNVQPMLSEFIDNTLSARTTWEVDRHLAECNSCTQVLNEMRRTVEIMSSAPQLEVSSWFGEKLQARLEALEPKPARWSWISSIGEVFRPAARPVLAALAACALTIAILSPRFGTNREIAPVRMKVPQNVQRAASQNVALSASDPLADIGAANLAAHSTGDEVIN